MSFLVNGLYKIADIEVFDARGQDERFFLFGTGSIEVDDLVHPVGDAGEALGELLKEFRLGDVLEGFAGVELFFFVRLGLPHGLHRPVDVLEARSLCRRCVGLIVFCVFVSACNIIYPDVGEGFVEAVGVVVGSLAEIVAGILRTLWAIVLYVLTLVSILALILWIFTL